METVRCCAERESVAADVTVVEIDVAIDASTHDAPPQVRQMYQC